MTQEDIIEMAKEAGFWQDLSVYEGLGEHFKAFAKLVAAKEREECAKVCGDLMFGANPYERWEGMKWCMEKIKARGEA